MYTLTGVLSRSFLTAHALVRNLHLAPHSPPHTMLNFPAKINDAASAHSVFVCVLCVPLPGRYFFFAARVMGGGSLLPGKDTVLAPTANCTAQVYTNAAVSTTTTHTIEILGGSA